MLVAIVSGRSFTARDLAGLAVVSLAWGAAFGLTLGPLTAFGLLRAVPLGRAVLGTAIGALLGVAATFGLGANPFVAIPVGFLAGAAFLRARYARIARARLPASERSDAESPARPSPWQVEASPRNPAGVHPPYEIPLTDSVADIPAVPIEPATSTRG